MSDALPLPAGFYPLIGLIKDPLLNAAGLQSQTGFCEHFDISLVYDPNPGDGGLTGMLQWTDKRAPPSSYFHETMGIAEVNMVRLLEAHTEISPIAVGEAIAAFTVQGHRHVLDLLALPEFIQRMKEALGIRFGILVAARNYLIAFRLVNDEEILRWQAISETKRKEFSQVHAFVLQGSRLSSLDTTRKLSLADFVIGKDPKDVGTGSVRPQGTSEVLLSGGIKSLSQEEKDALIQRAVLQMKMEGQLKRALSDSPKQSVPEDPTDNALQLARTWLESSDGGSMTVVSSKMLHVVSGTWPYYRDPQTLFLVQCQISDGTTVAVAVAPPMDNSGPAFTKFPKLSPIKKFTACVVVKGWWCCQVARRKYSQQCPDLTGLTKSMMKERFTAFTLKDFVCIGTEFLFIATAQRDGHLSQIEGSLTSNRLQPANDADKFFDPLALFVGRNFERSVRDSTP
jgi:hypothetical protein